MARSKEDLEHIIKERKLAPIDSLTERPLTMREVNAMHVDVFAWHEIYNKRNLLAAIEEPRIKAENKKNAKLATAHRQIVEEAATDEEARTAEREIVRFRASHPQYLGNFLPNNKAMLDWLKSHTLLITQENLTAAFGELAREGKLVVNPAAVGVIRIQLSNGRTEEICKEDLPVWQRRNGTKREAGRTVPIPVEILPFEEVTGAALIRSPQRDRLLSAYTPEIAQDLETKKLSADEWNRQHPLPLSGAELGRIGSQIKKAVDTFLSFHPEYAITAENQKHIEAYLAKRNLHFTFTNLEASYSELVREGYIETNEAVASGQATKMIDYAAEAKRTGAAETHSDAQTQRDIRKMNAKEYEVWLQNPDNRKAADRLAVAV
jgi:hypothetical protein